MVCTRPELRLVFTGGSGSSDETVTAAIDAYGLTNYVVRTGRIPETDLDLLYRSATVMAFPSLYEGFGIPVLEAMSRACPVVASDVGGLPEVIGGAGELVDPLDVVGWANALGDLVDDPARRTVLVRLGFDRAKHFDWSTPAQSLLSLYREIR
jgi:glycosyltransferase involved in cell wall biosynthesis